MGLIDKIVAGNGEMEDIDRLQRVAKNIEGRTICGFGEAAAWPIGGMLKHFRHEFEAYIRR